MIGVLYMIMCCGIQKYKSARQSSVAPHAVVYKKNRYLKCYHNRGRGENVALGKYVQTLAFPPSLPTPLTAALAV